ncbi:MAG: pyridoxal-phosphate dependent enzyme [Paracoccaceae bacterium]
MAKSPDINLMKEAKKSLSGRIVSTPVLELNGSKISPFLPKGSNVRMKMELFQHTGSFKSRGVLLALDKLSKKQKEKGVVAVSAGNHALAVSWASKSSGVNAKVVMLETSDPSRIQGCKDHGAEVILCGDVKNAFSKMEEIALSENRTILQPFDSESMVLGSASCGLEIIENFPELDVAIVPIGGGGLIAGIASAIKKSKPSTVIYGVEPEGADSMYRSFQNEKPIKLGKVETIADSLGSPMAMEYSFGVVHEFVDAVVRVKDDELIAALKLMRDRLNLIVEPACVASLAGLLGPLKQLVVGKAISIIACGSNISFDSYKKLIK